MSLLHYKVPLILLSFITVASKRLLLEPGTPLESKVFILLFDLLLCWIVAEYTLDMDWLEEEAWKRRCIHASHE